MPGLIDLLLSLVGRPRIVVVRQTTRRRARPKDHQRAKVYRWETAHILPNAPAILTLERCQALVLESYRWAEGDLALQPGWAPPLVTDGRGRRHACGSRQVIKLPRWSRTRPIVLHECAHGLAPDRHGPQFVAAYLALVEQFMELDTAVLRTTLEPAGVLVGTHGRGPAGELVLKAPRSRKAKATGQA